jgi:hypothetical protein
MIVYSQIYGVTLFEVSENGMLRTLGVAEDGVLISVKDNRDAFDLYHFSEISGWARTRYGIEIRINNPNKVCCCENQTLTLRNLYLN